MQDTNNDDSHILYLAYLIEIKTFHHYCRIIPIIRAVTLNLLLVFNMLSEHVQ